jgi:hypothetical protein
VESSTFGSESVAMQQAVDMIEGLRYKLRMMGVPIDEAMKVHCDNEAVVKATSRPESVLKKKHNAINYHRVREAQAAGFISIGWIISPQRNMFTSRLTHRYCLIVIIFQMKVFPTSNSILIKSSIT